jgi:hypothetical protein
VLFVSKTEQFAKQAQIPFDDESTIVVVTRDGFIAGFVKGEVTSNKIEHLQKMIATLYQ